MNRFLRAVGFCLVAFSGGVAQGCKTQYIPNTTVESNDLNRRVVAFAERYRQAVERHDIPALRKMAHPSYYEDGGNVDPSDDIDEAALEAYLQDLFSKARGIRYDVHYLHVLHGRGNLIQLEYSYVANYKVPSGHGYVWRHAVADNRLELVPDGDGFLIMSGM